MCGDKAQVPRIDAAEFLNETVPSANGDAPSVPFVDNGKHPRVTRRHSTYDVIHDRGHQHVARALTGLEPPTLPSARDRDDLYLRCGKCPLLAVPKSGPFVSRDAHELTILPVEHQKQSRVVLLGERVKCPVEERPPNKDFHFGLPVDLGIRTREALEHLPVLLSRSSNQPLGLPHAPIATGTRTFSGAGAPESCFASARVSVCTGAWRPNGLNSAEARPTSMPGTALMTIC